MEKPRRGQFRRGKRSGRWFLTDTKARFGCEQNVLWSLFLRSTFRLFVLLYLSLSLSPSAYWLLTFTRKQTGYRIPRARVRAHRSYAANLPRLSLLSHTSNPWGHNVCTLVSRSLGERSQAQWALIRWFLVLGASRIKKPRAEKNPKIPRASGQRFLHRARQQHTHTPDLIGKFIDHLSPVRR